MRKMLYITFLIAAEFPYLIWFLFFLIQVLLHMEKYRDIIRIIYTWLLVIQVKYHSLNATLHFQNLIW